MKKNLEIPKVLIEYKRIAKNHQPGQDVPAGLMSSPLCPLKLRNNVYTVVQWQMISAPKFTGSRHDNIKCHSKTHRNFSPPDHMSILILNYKKL